MAIIALNSPTKLSCTSLLSSSIFVIFAAKVNGNLLLAAPKVILENGVFSFKTNLISGIPGKPNKNESPSTSNLLMFSGIIFPKLFKSLKKSNIVS